MPTVPRAMGIDHGEARVGVAVADTLGMLAHPRETIRVDQKGDAAVVARIAAIARAEKIGVIVVGLPRNMNGTEGPAAIKVRAFADRLRAAAEGCEVHLQDERLTTVAAQKALHASGRDVKKGRKVIDQAAAQIILQTYLDTQALRYAEPFPGRRAGVIVAFRVDDPQTDATPAAGTTRRLRLLVAYDGRPFQGWQSQAHRDTVQDRLEAAFSILSGGLRIVVHGSGRTDAGVHAHGQVAHADVPAVWRHDGAQTRAALNAHLPPAIRVAQVRFVPDSFHARFSARGKVYRYRIWNDPVLDPFEIGRAWHFPGEIEDEFLRQAAQRLVGRHDFAAFAANRGKPETSTVRTIRRVAIRRRGPLLTLDFEGDGFLYKMVRLLTGSLVRCAQGRATVAWLDELLSGTNGKTSFVAPAEGLYLVRVLYGRAMTKKSMGLPSPQPERTPPTPTNRPARS